MGYKDRILVNAGEILSRKHVNQLKKWEKRDKPLGPALRKTDPKDVRERVQHAEWQGGYRPSHFNPRGFLVSATLSSGEETPRVEKDPTLSPVIQNTARKSFNVPIDVQESPLIREMHLKAEIKSLEMINAQLGGNIHTLEDNITGEENLQARKDSLIKQNSEIIVNLKEGKINGKQANNNKQDEIGTPVVKRRGRPSSKR